MYLRGDEEARAIRHRLRLRLGALTSKKLVTGKSLHDACRSAELWRVRDTHFFCALKSYDPHIIP